MENYLKKIPFFRDKKEQFLVIEILKNFVRVSLFGVDFDTKVIELLNIVNAIVPSTDEYSQLDVLKKNLKQFGKLSKYKIIISLDSEFATTIHSTVVLERDAPQEPIDESDLDNRIAQGIWRVFDRERGKAAKKMGISALDVLSTDVKIKQVRLDSHKVLNPTGFKAKLIELQFLQTFMPRGFVGKLKEIIPPESIVFMGESGIMATDLLSRAGRLNPIFVVDLLFDRTSVFFADKEGLSYVETISWGRQNLMQSLGDLFGSNEQATETILERYALRQASRELLRKMETCLNDSFSEFTQQLMNSVTNYKPARIYLISSSDLPPSLIGKRFRSRARKQQRFSPVNHGFIRDRLGFKLIMEEEENHTNLFGPLAALLEFYFLPQNDTMNKIARRHARWLIS